jgi:hypothetical protein
MNNENKIAIVVEAQPAVVCVNDSLYMHLQPSPSRNSRVGVEMEKPLMSLPICAFVLTNPDAD